MVFTLMKSGAKCRAMRYHKPRLIIMGNHAMLASDPSDIVQTRTVFHRVVCAKDGNRLCFIFGVDARNLKIEYPDQETELMIGCDEKNGTLLRPQTIFEHDHVMKTKCDSLNLFESSPAVYRQYGFASEPDDRENQDRDNPNRDTPARDTPDQNNPSSQTIQRDGGFPDDRIDALLQGDGYTLSRSDLHWQGSQNIPAEELAARSVVIEKYDGGIVCRDAKEKSKVYFALGKQQGNASQYHCRLSEAEKFFQFLLDHMTSDGDTVSIGLCPSLAPKLFAYQSIDDGNVVDSCFVILVQA